MSGLPVLPLWILGLRAAGYHIHAGTQADVVERHRARTHLISNEGKNTTQTAKNHGQEPPHTSPPSTPTNDSPLAETATTCTTGAANATGGGRARAAPKHNKFNKYLLNLDWRIYSSQYKF
jgi:hypothetical protein